MEAKGDFEIPKISLISQQCGHLSPGDFKKAWPGLENTTSTSLVVVNQPKKKMENQRIVDNSSKISNHDFFWEEFSVSVLQSKQVWVPSAVIPSKKHQGCMNGIVTLRVPNHRPPQTANVAPFDTSTFHKKYQTIKPNHRDMNHQTSVWLIRPLWVVEPPPMEKHESNHQTANGFSLNRRANLERTT